MSYPQFRGWGAQEPADVAVPAAAAKIVHLGFGAQSRPAQWIGLSVARGCGAGACGFAAGAAAAALARGVVGLRLAPPSPSLDFTGEGRD